MSYSRNHNSINVWRITDIGICPVVADICSEKSLTIHSLRNSLWSFLVVSLSLPCTLSGAHPLIGIVSSLCGYSIGGAPSHDVGPGTQPLLFTVGSEKINPSLFPRTQLFPAVTNVQVILLFPFCSLRSFNTLVTNSLH